MYPTFHQSLPTDRRIDGWQLKLLRHYSWNRGTINFFPVNPSIHPPFLALFPHSLKYTSFSWLAVSKGKYIFHLSSSDKDMSGNVWNRPSGSFMVDMGISSNIMKSPSPKCYMTFWDMVIYSDTLTWSDIIPIFEPITELDLITNFDLIT